MFNRRSSFQDLQRKIMSHICKEHGYEVSFFGQDAISKQIILSYQGINGINMLF